MSAALQTQLAAAPATDVRPRRGRPAPVSVEDAKAFLSGLTRDQKILSDEAFLEKARRGLERERSKQVADAEREKRERFFAAQG